VFQKNAVNKEIIMSEKKPPTLVLYSSSVFKFSAIGDPNKSNYFRSK